MLSVEELARVCHEANRAYCEALGDHSQKPWAEADEWQHDTVRNGVQFRLDNPNEYASASHDNWLRVKSREGWVYGPVKDEKAKTHPCIMAFEELPIALQRKDRMFCAIIDALRGEE